MVLWSQAARVAWTIWSDAYAHVLSGEGPGGLGPPGRDRGDACVYRSRIKSWMHRILFLITDIHSFFPAVKFLCRAYSGIRDTTVSCKSSRFRVGSLEKKDAKHTTAQDDFSFTKS